MVTVQVPATSANLGSGFDTIGIALQLYNTVSARETEGGLNIQIKDETSRFLPRDERNLVYRAMRAVFDEVGYSCRGIHIIQNNRIPVTRGLGSSSASIVGGLFAANAISGNHLSREQLITLAAKLEGHPDNTTPAITGGMAIAVKADGICSLHVPIREEDLSFVLFVPDFILRTKKARSVLPRMVPHRDAVFNTGRAALLTAAMITRQYDCLSVALQDRLHQPYRKGLIKGANHIIRQSRELGALGTYISGAGPTMMAIVKRRDKEDFQREMDAYLKRAMPNWSMQIVAPDNRGARLIEGGQRS